MSQLQLPEKWVVGPDGLIKPKGVQDNFDTIVREWASLVFNGAAGPPGPAGPAGDQNVYIQTTDPAAATPYLWVEIDGGGSVVSMWVNA